MVGRDYRCRRLGTELINWAGWRAWREHGAQWNRVNAWTANNRLHDYYRREGFEEFEKCVDDGYPGGAFFQKPISQLSPELSLFVVDPETQDGISGRR